MNMDTLTIDVNRCARCGHDHQQLAFKKFSRRPYLGPLGDVLEYWAPCPATGEPILMNVGRTPTDSRMYLVTTHFSDEPALARFDVERGAWQVQPFQSAWYETKTGVKEWWPHDHLVAEA